jgi:hypothetical protein
MEKVITSCGIVPAKTVHLCAMWCTTNRPQRSWLFDTCHQRNTPCSNRFILNCKAQHLKYNNLITLNYKRVYIPLSHSQIKDVNVAPTTYCVTILKYKPTANRHCLFRTTSYLKYTQLHASRLQTLPIFNFLRSVSHGRLLNWISPYNISY